MHGIAGGFTHPRISSMLLSQRILGFPQDEIPADRRLDLRYCISPRFPLRTVLILAGPDDVSVSLPFHEGGGRDWAGRLINISRLGARIQLPPKFAAKIGERCTLKLDLEGHLLQLTGQIAHITERRDSMNVGLLMDPIEPAARAAYDQFVELIALGATLRPTKPAEPHDDYYLVEQYEGETGTRLNVWRSCTGHAVAAFEFRLRDYRVRGLAGRRELEYLFATAVDGESLMASEQQSAEMHQLFHWVVPNLPTIVPADVREFLLQYAA
jgi:hypothetical protein